MIVENRSDLVTVLICSYNGHQRIGKAIRSVLDQTYENFELLVVDDGSKNSLESVVASFSDDTRVRFYRFETNVGLHAAREFGVRKAKGSTVALLDDDDLWLPEKLECQLMLVEADPNIGMVCTGAIDIYPDGNRLLRLPPAPVIHYRQELISECTIASSVLFRKAVYEEVGGFDGSLRRCGDWDCWIRLARRYLIKAIMLPLVLTNMRQGSLQRSRDIEAFADDRWKIIEKHRKEINEMGLWPDAISSHFHSIGIRYLRAGKFEEARHLLGKALKHKFQIPTAIAFLLSCGRIKNDFRYRKMARIAKQIISSRAK